MEPCGLVRGASWCESFSSSSDRFLRVNYALESEYARFPARPERTHPNLNSPVMKAAILAPSNLLAVASAFVVPASASLVPLNALTLFALVSGAAALGLLTLAWSEYMRKPRFRAPSSRKPAQQSVVPVQPGFIDTSVAWTYQTVSA